MSEKKLLTMFMEKMVTDETFEAKVAGLQTPADLMELAKELDMELSEEQAEKGLVHVQKLSEENVTDGGLEDVAGGSDPGGESFC